MNIEIAARRLEALGNPTRLEIYRLLVRSGPAGRSVGDIQGVLDIPGSTLSHHISKLVWVGLVDQERQGRTLICRPNFDAMNEAIGFLQDECCADAPEGADGTADASA
jgi:DNA-binding transcriptional ArsR family regulator